MKTPITTRPNVWGLPAVACLVIALSALPAPVLAAHPVMLDGAVGTESTVSVTSGSSAADRSVTSTGGLVTFTTGALPEDLKGASWTLSTGVGPQGLDWTPLATGTLGAGNLTLSLPVASLAQTTNRHFMLVIYKRIDSDHAYLGNALVGMPLSELVDGRTIAMTPVINKVVTYPSQEAAIAASSCATCLPWSDPRRPTSAVGPASSSPPSARPNPRVPARLAPSSQSSTNESDIAAQLMAIVTNAPDIATNVVGNLPNPTPYLNPPGGLLGSNPPISSCTLTGGCVTAQEAPQYGCQDHTDNAQTTRDCVDDAHDWSGNVFRGWANRVPGMRDDFEVDNGYEQTWQNGYRTQAGPFSVNGSTTTQDTKGSTITYQRRGDCWSPAQPGDDTYCDYGGFSSNWGADTWRWEKHSTTDCVGGAVDCQTATYEVVFDAAFQGGASPMGYEHNFYRDQAKPPFDVQNGQEGLWDAYPPDSARTSKLETSLTVDNGFSVDVNWSGSYGGVDGSAGQSYTSSESDNTVNLQLNSYTFRGPASGTPWMGMFYRYDGTPPGDGNNDHWKFELWSCQYAPGYAGAVSKDQLYENGGGTACWMSGNY